jgi:hypothetical protein
VDVSHVSRFVGGKKEYRIMNKEHRISKESPHFDIPGKGKMIPVYVNMVSGRRKSFLFIAIKLSL